MTEQPERSEEEPTGQAEGIPAEEPGQSEHVEVPDDISGIDTGAGTDPAPAGEAGAPDAAQVDGSQREAELLADLQRVQAEFLNYKRRVERDRELVKQNAVFNVLTPMLDVLDNIDRAREAGELEGGFKGVAEQLETIVTALGLTRFGTPGDEFDPTFHDALSHLGSDQEVQVVTVKHVAKGGYRIGDRVVRAAQVLVVDPVQETDADQG